MVGWVSHPDVNEFTVKFSDGRETTLNAQLHQYFVGVLDEQIADFPVDSPPREFACEEITVRDVTAFDENGDPIE